MNQPSPSLHAVDHGDHMVIPADVQLQKTALRSASAADIAGLLANAENALGALRNEFGRWLEAESTRLGQLLEDYLADTSPAQKDMLYRALHDMRGNSAAFGNALAGRIADNMCKLFDTATSVPMPIVEAHIHAIQAVIREKITTTDHPMGNLMVKELMKVSMLAMRTGQA